MSEFYDRGGNPISMSDWSNLFENPEYKIVEKTDVGDAQVSTVWLGMNHGWNGEVRIFETMIFGGDWDQHQWRYETEKEAIEGHAKVVQSLKEHLSAEGL